MEPISAFQRLNNFAAADAQSHDNVNFTGTVNMHSMQLRGTIADDSYVRFRLPFTPRRRMVVMVGPIWHIQANPPSQDDKLYIRVLDQFGVVLAQTEHNCGAQGGANAKYDTSIFGTNASPAHDTFANMDIKDGGNYYAHHSAIYLDMERLLANYTQGHNYSGIATSPEWGTMHAYRSATNAAFTGVPYEIELRYVHDAGGAGTGQITIQGIQILNNPVIAIGDSNCLNMITYGLGQSNSTVPGHGMANVPILCCGTAGATVVNVSSTEMLSLADRWKNYTYEKWGPNSSLRVMVGPLGMNDILQGESWATIKAGLDTIFADLAARPLEQLIIVNCAPYGFWNAGAGPVPVELSAAMIETLGHLHDYLAGTARNLHANHVDIHKPLRFSHNQACPEYYRFYPGNTVDGVHPTAYLGHMHAQRLYRDAVAFAQRPFAGASRPSANPNALNPPTSRQGAINTGFNNALNTPVHPRGRFTGR